MKSITFLNSNKTAMLAAAFVLSLGFSSCKKDFLEVTPTQSIQNGDAFTSAEKLEAAMTGIYDINTNSAYTNNVIMNADVKGEDVLVASTNNYNRFITGYQFSEIVTSGELRDHWQFSYRLIANANQLIANTPNAPVAEAVKNQYIAEARAMRASAYFTLIREFAKPYSLDPEALGVPIIDKPIGPSESPARAKVKDVYAFILEDLKFAEANFPATKKDVMRITLNAIQGLQARVYLTMGNWAEASKYAKLARTGYALSTGNALLAGFADKTSEWIWAVDMRSDDNQGYLQVPSFYDPYDIGYSSFRASNEFVNLFADTDIRKNQFRIPAVSGGDPKLGQYRPTNDGYFMSKFIFRGAWDNDMVLMRSSEMYLIEAEAEARLGNEPAAKTALLAIQQRAGVTSSESANTGEALIQEILVERRKELFGEGHRFYDILRTKQTLDRSASTSHWSKVVIPAGDKRLTYPIPQAEIDANPNIIQN
ncbi:MAG TPA: RagB/SusD family nutrient uptake outer membrane protein [Sphingobacteriaceae bacterium]